MQGEGLRVRRAVPARSWRGVKLVRNASEGAVNARNVDKCAELGRKTFAQRAGAVQQLCDRLLRATRPGNQKEWRFGGSTGATRFGESTPGFAVLSIGAWSVAVSLFFKPNYKLRVATLQ